MYIRLLTIALLLSCVLCACSGASDGISGSGRSLPASASSAEAETAQSSDPAGESALSNSGEAQSVLESAPSPSHSQAEPAGSNAAGQSAFDDKTKRELDTVDLTNNSKTEYAADVKAGDVFLGLEVLSVLRRQELVFEQWHDQSVDVRFAGEKTIDVLYFDLRQPMSVTMLAGKKPDSILPDVVGELETQGLHVSDITALEQRAVEYLATMEKPADAGGEKQIAIFLCKMKVDNIMISARSGSMAARIVNCAELLSFELEGLYTQEEIYQKLGADE